MIFEEALKALREGKTIKRKDEPSHKKRFLCDKHIAINPTICSIYGKKHIGCSFSDKDILAEDWEIEKA